MAVVKVKKFRRSAKMTQTAIQLRSKVVGLSKNIHEITGKVAAEKRDMSSEELEKFNKLVDEVSDLNSRVSTLESTKDEEYEDEEDDAKQNEDGNRSAALQFLFEHGIARSAPTPGANHNPLKRRSYESDSDFNLRMLRSKPEYGDAVADYLTGRPVNYEQRAMQADLSTSGGYLALPEKTANMIIKGVDNMLPFMQKATVISLTDAQSLGAPTLDTNPDDAEWTQEIGTFSEDSAMKVGKRLLTPFPLRKMIKVSEKFLRIAITAAYMSADEKDGTVVNGEKFVTDRMAYKLGVAQEKAFMTGNSAGRALGIFVASSRGVSTGRDVLTGSNTTYTYNGLVNAKFSLKAQYHASAQWLFHRDGMAKIMQLVDGNGRPLLNFSTLPDTPVTLLQCPVNLSEYVPNTFSAAAYTGMICDPRFYLIARAMEIRVLVAKELYAGTGQVAFFVSTEVDGMPVLEEAYARLKQGA